MKRTASATVPVLVCTLAIFLLSAMDAGMKSLVLAVGVYNVVLWRSVLAAGASAAGWAARSPSWPGPRALRLHALLGQRLIRHANFLAVPPANEVMV